MTEPENVHDEEVTDEWGPPAATIRAVYDEDHRINSLMVEYRDTPSSEDVARVLAQFLTLQPGQLPRRTPGAGIPRDMALERKFREIVGGCGSISNGLDSLPGQHENHACFSAAGHAGKHRCECGAEFGG